MSDTEIKRYCINRAGNDMVPQELGAFCFHHEVKDLIDAKDRRIAELEAKTMPPTVLAWTRLYKDLQVREDMIAEQASRIAELEKDAARYRQLRKHSYIELRCDSPRIDGWTPDRLDAAIDAWINGAGPQSAKSTQQQWFEEGCKPPPSARFSGQQTMRRESQPVDVDYRNSVLEEAAEMLEDMRWGWDGDCGAASNVRGMKSR